jgi:hypothetical protein
MRLLDCWIVKQEGTHNSWGVTSQGWYRPRKTSSTCCFSHRYQPRCKEVACCRQGRYFSQSSMCLDTSKCRDAVPQPTYGKTVWNFRIYTSKGNKTGNKETPGPTTRIRVSASVSLRNMVWRNIRFSSWQWPKSRTIDTDGVGTFMWYLIWNYVSSKAVCGQVFITKELFWPAFQKKNWLRFIDVFR